MTLCGYAAQQAFQSFVAILADLQGTITGAETMEGRLPYYAIVKGCKNSNCLCVMITCRQAMEILTSFGSVKGPLDHITCSLSTCSMRPPAMSSRALIQGHKAQSEAEVISDRHCRWRASTLFGSPAMRSQSETENGTPFGVGAGQKSQHSLYWEVCV